MEYWSSYVVGSVSCVRGLGECLLIRFLNFSRTHPFHPYGLWEIHPERVFWTLPWEGFLGFVWERHCLGDVKIWWILKYGEILCKGTLIDRILSGSLSIVSNSIFWLWWRCSLIALWLPNNCGSLGELSAVVADIGKAYWDSMDWIWYVNLLLTSVSELVSVFVFGILELYYLWF